MRKYFRVTRGKREERGGVSGIIYGNHLGGFCQPVNQLAIPTSFLFVLFKVAPSFRF